MVSTICICMYIYIYIGIGKVILVANRHMAVLLVECNGLTCTNQQCINIKINLNV